MSFKKLVIGAAAVVSLAACSKSNDSSARMGAVSAPALDNNGQSVGTYSAGTPLYSFGVASLTTSEDGKIIEGQGSFLDPNVASEVSSLSAVDKVIQTKEQSLEMWSQGNLLLAFDLRSGTPTLLSKGAFAISSATFVMNAGNTDKQGQGLASADLTLTLQDCAVEQKQEQGKVEQGQDQGKAPMDQGKKSFVAAVSGADVQGQGQSQGKEQPKQEQGKPEEKAPSCHSVTMVYHLTEIAQPKQEQDQGKQGQDQGKAPIDQGKQGQDQGKAPIDQGKQGQDQGKAPIDQGKK